MSAEERRDKACEGDMWKKDMEKCSAEKVYKAMKYVKKIPIYEPKPTPTPVQWRTATCEHCVYRVYSYCRRFPPSYTRRRNGSIVTNYAIVHEEDTDGVWDFMLACAEFKDKDMSDE